MSSLSDLHRVRREAGALRGVLRSATGPACRTLPVVDFAPIGIGFLIDCRLECHTRLSVDLGLDDLEVQRVPCAIVDCVGDGDHYRCRAHFLVEEVDHNTRLALRLIASQLAIRRHQRERAATV